MTVIEWFLGIALILVALLVIGGVALTKHEEGKGLVLNTHKGGAHAGQTKTVDEKLTLAVTALAVVFALLLMLAAAL